MTREEAIKMLKSKMDGHTDTSYEWAETVRMAIQALSQESCGDCIYCHEDSDGYVKPIEKNSHAFIRFGMDGWELSLHAKGWHGSAKIKYCPMCGRKLMGPK